MRVWTTVPDDVRSQCSRIEQSIAFSEEVLQSIKADTLPLLETENGNVAIVFAGSVGRKEVSVTSDVDAFVLFDEESPDYIERAETILSQLKGIIETKTDLKMASKGAFSDYCILNNLLSRIGGDEETNRILTQRMVLLVESQGISSKGFYEESKRRILTTFLEELQPKERRPIFLINELARYYRTICVDYEYKKNRAGKPWAVRLIKLRHSRKLFYFSALLPLLESLTIEDTNERLRWIHEQFIEYTPLQRMILLLHKYGRPQDWEILVSYNQFLEFLSSGERRQQLNGISFDNRKDDTVYGLMRDNAREFRAKLLDFMLSVEPWQDNMRKYVIC